MLIYNTRPATRNKKKTVMILVHKCILSYYFCCFRIWRFYRVTNWRWCFRGHISHLQMDKKKMSWCTIIYMGSFIGNCVSISANWCQWIIDLKQKTFQNDIDILKVEVLISINVCFILFKISINFTNIFVWLFSCL